MKLFQHGKLFFVILPGQDVAIFCVCKYFFVFCVLMGFMQIFCKLFTIR